MLHFKQSGSAPKLGIVGFGVPEAHVVKNQSKIRGCALGYAAEICGLKGQQEGWKTPLSEQC